jgi:pimeloyl-ACP methyl ester carboxylesterase
VVARLRAIVADYSGWHWLHSDPRRSLEPPAITRLAEIAAPTLAIVGQHDLADFHAIADLLATQAPAGRRVVLPGVGHLANMEAPDACNEVVLDFLAEQGL